MPSIRVKNLNAHLRAVLLGLALAGLTLLAWRWAHPGQGAPQAQLPVAGLAYSGFQRWQSPLERRYPDTADLEEDLRILRPLTGRLRTYSSAEVPQLPALAARQGLRLTAGVWLSGRAQDDEREIRSVIEAVASNHSIERVIAGNETQLHGSLKPDELITTLQRLRRQLKVPVSTAEPWHIWLGHPELAEQVDFIAVHLLPYWEGVPASVAVHEVWRRYDEIRARFPDKPVVIAEVGWPSGGAIIEKRVAGLVNRASASPEEQARFLREFVASAHRRAEPVDYFLMEAVDQPWKAATEGDAGPHWGVLDARRQAKFDWVGPVEHNPHWRGQALSAALLGLLIALPVMVKFAHLRWPARVSFGVSVHAVASLVVVLATLPLVDYLRVLDGLLMGLLIPALLLMGAILVTQLLEFAELFWDGHLRRRQPLLAWPASLDPPLVSIHLACSNEPPEMVCATIASLQRLDWPALEIIVVDNNTRDEACWRPVQAYVAQERQRGDKRLKFIHLPHWPGYKAGALNVALRATHRRAAWVAVVDADYVVRADWLRSVAGHFIREDVAVVQAPQAHRGWDADRLSRMMNWEYDGFFRLGMHHRHERNAIVQHGTMTLIRARALRQVGGWSTDCVCEDTELGLRLLKRGWQKVYVDEVMGTGLVPNDFAAYQRQRRRWAQGAMQILRLHRGALFGGKAGLSLGQRYHFIAGWLPWFGDLLHLVFTLTALGWSLGVWLAPERFSLPLAYFAAPLAAFFLVRLVLVPLLYARRVPCGWADVAGAAWAGMALSHAIAMGILAGLVRRRAVFHVTRRRGGEGPEGAPPVQERTPWRAVAPQALLLLALMMMGLGLLAQSLSPSPSMVGWMVILALQGLPYAAALSCMWWSRGPRGLGIGAVGAAGPG